MAAERRYPTELVVSGCDDPWFNGTYTKADDTYNGKPYWKANSGCEIFWAVNRVWIVSHPNGNKDYDYYNTNPQAIAEASVGWKKYYNFLTAIDIRSMKVQPPPIAATEVDEKEEEELLSNIAMDETRDGLRDVVKQTSQVVTVVNNLGPQLTALTATVNQLVHRLNNIPGNTEPIASVEVLPEATGLRQVLNAIREDDEADCRNVSRARDHLERQVQCVVCMAEQRCMLFQPCNHLVSCQACSGNLNTCPVCRHHITNRYKAIIS